MKTKLFVSIIITLSIINAEAQEQKQHKSLEDVVIANFSYTNYGESKFQKDNQVGEVGFSEFRFAYAIPKLLKNKKTILIHGLELTNLEPNFSEVPNSSPVSRNLYSAAYRFAINNPLGDKGWKYTLGLKPTLASDFKESITTEDFILQASALFSKRAHENFNYGFGISYSTRFGKKQILPILQLIYKKNNWATIVYLPATIGQYYYFNSSRLGVSVNLNGNSYNFDNTNTSGLDLDKLSYTRMNIGPEYEVKLAKRIKLNLSGGLALANKLEWLNGDGDSELDLSPENKVFFKIGLKLVR